MPYLPVRDFIGYGDKPPAAEWPGGAKLALNIVVNYEEGAEYSIGEGDGVSEAILSDLAVSPAVPGLRNRNMESLYEYGSRVGVWRLASLFREKNIIPTFYVVGRALQLNPAAGKAIATLGSDIVCHGWRWIDYAPLSEAEERNHIALTGGHRPAPDRHSPARLVHRPAQSQHAAAGGGARRFPVRLRRLQ